MDALMLSRIQFAANITFHILFPAITIALCWFLLFFRLRYDATSDEKWLEAYCFWMKMFALCFALGVVSGVTMSFQFGTNWPGYMQHAGNIAGPLLGYEVLTAFFLEATFLGDHAVRPRARVRPPCTLLAAMLVAVGTTVSAFWILALNSWMQTPAGYPDRSTASACDSWLGVHLQSVLPVPAHAQAARLGADRLRFSSPGFSAYQLAAQATRRGSVAPAHRRHRRGDRHSPADRRRRPARAEHAGAPAGQDRRNRGHLEHRKHAPLHLFAMAERAGGQQSTTRSRCPIWRA